MDMCVYVNCVYATLYLYDEIINDDEMTLSLSHQLSLLSGLVLLSSMQALMPGQQSEVLNFQQEYNP